MIKKFYLIDQDPLLVAAWKKAFESYKQVEIIEGDFFSKQTDLMVSPANSFGIMNGGLDLAIRNKLGEKTEALLQHEIVQQYQGELVVGQAHIIETGNTSWPFLISAPTIRVPMSIHGTLNVYYAFRAILQTVKKHNDEGGNISSILCPGLGTGIGNMPVEKAAGQMAFAFQQYQQDAQKPLAKNILFEHAKIASFI